MNSQGCECGGANVSCLNLSWFKLSSWFCEFMLRSRWLWIDVCMDWSMHQERNRLLMMPSPRSRLWENSCWECHFQKILEVGAQRRLFSQRKLCGKCQGLFFGQKTWSWSLGDTNWNRCKSSGRSQWGFRKGTALLLWRSEGPQCKRFVLISMGQPTITVLFHDAIRDKLGFSFRHNSEPWLSVFICFYYDYHVDVLRRADWNVCLGWLSSVALAKWNKKDGPLLPRSHPWSMFVLILFFHFQPTNHES